MVPARRLQVTSYQICFFLLEAVHSVCGTLSSFSLAANSHKIVNTDGLMIKVQVMIKVQFKKDCILV